MRHSLAQLLAASSSDKGRPREPAAACSFPREGTPAGSGSPGEEGGEAEPHHEEAAAAGLLDEPDGDELLFPAGLELEDWLEAAVAETRTDWEMIAGGDGDGGLSPTLASEPQAASRPDRPGSYRLKAAAAARLNRQKKKQYVLGLESRLQGLSAENRQLRDRNRGLCRRLRDLERETSYLRAVLANQSALGRLLSHLAGDGAGRVGLRISSSLFEDRAAPPPLEGPLPRERSSSSGSSGSSGSSSDHDYALPVPVQQEDKKKGGKYRGYGEVNQLRQQVGKLWTALMTRFALR
ncbi:CREB/ATF bZIP transcription factor [Varanus komodoensis]|nr:CREB/ATF bZIP transcription factor [Varanus komodoensis]